MRGGRVDQAPPRILSSVFFKRLWLHGTFFARARVSDEPGTEVVPTASSVRTECAIQPHWQSGAVVYPRTPWS